MKLSMKLHSHDQCSGKVSCYLENSNGTCIFLILEILLFVLDLLNTNEQQQPFEIFKF